MECSPTTIALPYHTKKETITIFKCNQKVFQKKKKKTISVVSRMFKEARVFYGRAREILQNGSVVGVPLRWRGARLYEAHFTQSQHTPTPASARPAHNQRSFWGPTERLPKATHRYTSNADPTANDATLLPTHVRPCAPLCSVAWQFSCAKKKKESLRAPPPGVPVWLPLARAGRFSAPSFWRFPCRLLLSFPSAFVPLLLSPFASAPVALALLSRFVVLLRVRFLARLLWRCSVPALLPLLSLLPGLSVPFLVGLGRSSLPCSPLVAPVPPPLPSLLPLVGGFSPVWLAPLAPSALPFPLSASGLLPLWLPSVFFVAALFLPLSPLPRSLRLLLSGPLVGSLVVPVSFLPPFGSLLFLLLSALLFPLPSLAACRWRGTLPVALLVLLFPFGLPRLLLLLLLSGFAPVLLPALGSFPACFLLPLPGLLVWLWLAPAGVPLSALLPPGLLLPLGFFPFSFPPLALLAFLRGLSLAFWRWWRGFPPPPPSGGTTDFTTVPFLTAFVDSGLPTPPRQPTNGHTTKTYGELN